MAAEDAIKAQDVEVLRSNADAERDEAWRCSPWPEVGVVAAEGAMKTYDMEAVRRLSIDRECSR